ncbi:nicotinamide riboside transporter PnuC [Sphingomonas soli]|uniref:nicotinamide riboside transporter PnuC n=1 Tax=Sphingomonas soli TaxID=266127 RepID=UPI000834AC34|nr:nicotinamide riboside transporter PnuC [Sphingomonas soli]
MNPLELAAAALGLINVALVARRSLWNYPFGLAMVALYFFVFAEARLYSDALLQIFFFAIQLYGWWNWSRSDRVDHGVAIGRLSNPARTTWLAGTMLTSAAWGAAMANFTDAAAPYPDAAIAGMSVAAQILQSRRRFESWLLWICVDCIAIGLFWSRGLHPTAILYAIFLGMAVWGLFAWRSKLDPAQ